jgi:hypothetical protein
MPILVSNYRRNLCARQSPLAAQLRRDDQPIASLVFLSIAPHSDHPETQIPLLPNILPILGKCVEVELTIVRTCIRKVFVTGQAGIDCQDNARSRHAEHQNYTPHPL